MIFLYALTMNALTLSMIDNFVHAFAVVCKLLTLKLIYTPYVLSYFKRLMFFHTLKDCHVFILLWCYSHKKMLKDRKHFTKVLTVMYE